MQRHPGDALRVVLGSVTAALGGWIARAHRIGTAESDVFQLINRLPGWLEPPLAVVMQAGSLAAVGVTAAVALLARQVRMAADLLLSGGLAWLAARGLKLLVGRGRPSTLLLEVTVRGREQIGFGYPSGHAAVAAALATAAAPYLPRPWRRALWGVVAVVAVARVFVGAHLPVDVVGGVALGWAIGAAVHLLLGAPGQHPTRELVLAAAHAIGVPAADAVPLSADARASRPFTLKLQDGSGVFAKVVSREQRDADLMFKLWRYLIYRTVEDEAPFATPKQQIEHEAYISLLAERAGVRVPVVLSASQANASAAMLLQRLVPDAHGLDELEQQEIDDDLLRELWEQVAALHRARVAHRDLRLTNVLVTGDRRPWLVDFGFGEGAASDRRIAMDVTELLAATAVVVGPRRAVDAAAKVLEPVTLVDAARMLQPLALSTATRREARGRLEELRNEVGRRTGGDVGPVPPITRVHVRPRVVLALVVAAVGIHVLLPQVGELGQTLRVLRTGQLDWVVAGLIGSALTYVAAAVALAGAVARPLPFGRTLTVQVAASFASRLAPWGVGGLSLNEGYLERAGVPRAAAVAGLGANTVAGFLVHLTMLALTVAAFGTADVGPFRMPRGWPALAAVLAVGVLVVVIAGLPSTRRKLLRPALAALRDLGPILRRPGKAAALFGGSAALTVLYILTLTASLRAFGADIASVHVAAVYLVGAAAGSISPTPGGLGVVEAALVAGLTGLNVDSGQAVAGVLTFRLLTYWLPILPGALLIRQLQRHHAI